jgi:hypothetical protein
MPHAKLAAAADQMAENPLPENIRTGQTVAALKRAFLDNLFYSQGRFLEVAKPNDLFQALAHTVRDHLLHRWVSTVQTYAKSNCRTVCYLSAEYLPGPHLANNLLNLGITENVRLALAELGLDLATAIRGKSGGRISFTRSALAVAPSSTPMRTARRACAGCRMKRFAASRMTHRSSVTASTR